MNRALEQIDRFFNPRKVALIGVNRSFGFGGGLTRFMVDIGWGDRIYPVNPNLEELDGLKVWPSIRDVPDDVDVACILVAAPIVPQVLDECIEKGVRSVILMSAGFSEIGSEGRENQQALTDRVRGAGVRMMGPNCLGVVNVARRFATCELVMDALKPGNISVVAQSGVFGNIIIDSLPAQGMGVAKVATIGNRADLDETDFLEYLAADDQTRVIVLYLESILRGRAFLDAARRASRVKPVVAYLGGQTEGGRRATRSHTGSLAGFGAVEMAALRQAGITVARDPLELMETAKVFSLCAVPEGDRILVVTASGSLGVMAADRICQEGLTLAELTPESTAQVREKAPRWMNLGNPMDVGPSGLFSQAMDIAFHAPEVDAAVVLPVIPWAIVRHIWERSPEEVASLFLNRSRLDEVAGSRPIVVSAQGHPDWQQACGEMFGPRIPLVSTPQAAVSTLAALYRYGRWRTGRGG